MSPVHDNTEPPSIPPFATYLYAFSLSRHNNIVSNEYIDRSTTLLTNLKY